MTNTLRKSTKYDTASIAVSIATVSKLQQLPYRTEFQHWVAVQTRQNDSPLNDHRRFHVGFEPEHRLL